MVARDGIEPPTPAFSGLQSINPILLKVRQQTQFYRPEVGPKVQPSATIGSFRSLFTESKVARGRVCLFHTVLRLPRRFAADRRTSDEISQEQKKESA